MTLETIEDAALVTSAPHVTDVTSAGLEKLRQWVVAAQHAHQLVAPLVTTPFVPASYKPKVDPRATDQEKREAYEIAVATATAAVLQGISVGLDPLTALQQIYVVHGRPGMYTKIKVALVQAAGHEVWTEDTSGTRAVVAGRRKGTQHIERVTITMDMARAAGWTKNDTYAKTPADMLWARAAGRVCDRIASDVLNGIASVEEIHDETAEAAPSRTVRRGRQAPPAGEPSERPVLPGEAVAADLRRGDLARSIEADYQDARDTGAVPLPGDEQPVETGEQISQQQGARISALFRDLGLPGQSAAEKAQRLRVASTFVQRDVATASDLTSVEADTLVGLLEQLLAKPDAERRAALDFMLADEGEPPADDGALPLPGDE